MTTMQERPCEDVRLAVQALLDGEPSGMTSREIQVHTGDCVECRAALAGLAAVHAALGRMDFEALDVDLWSVFRQQIALERPRRAPTRHLRFSDRRSCSSHGAWRSSFGLPAPVINSVVPLAAVIVVLWRLAATRLPSSSRSMRFIQIPQKGATMNHTDSGRRPRPALHVCHGGARDWPPQLRESVRLREIDPGDRARPEGASEGACAGAGSPAFLGEVGDRGRRADIAVVVTVVLLNLDRIPKLIQAFRAMSDGL